METFKNLLFLLLFGFLIWFFSQFVAWYWATGIALLIVGYFFPNTNSKSKKKSKAVTAKSFIEEGKIYSEQEAVDTLTEFFKALGLNGYEESAQKFPKLIDNVRQSYRNEIKDWEREITSHQEHFANEVFGDEEDKEFSKKYMESEIKKCQKCIDWYKKQIVLLEGDLSPVMKKIMNESKREGTSSTFEMEHRIEQLILKELPDSYY